MKTLTLKTNLTKAALLGALTVAPALGLTASAQAAPSYRDYQRYQAPRFDSRPNQGYNNRYNNGRYDNYRNNDYRNNGRFDSRRDYNRRDYNRRDRNNGNDTGKIIGAGIVGAILGAVLSR